MSTLLLRLAAPLQSWGTDSKFDIRKTARDPTKSGVLGLAAAALGRRRNEPTDDLRALRFGVRVEREGRLLHDFHMVKGAKASYVTHRYYLSDAVFLAGLEGDEALLEQIEAALHRPAFPLSLGRRSCPPEGRISLGIRRGASLEDALKSEPWLLWAGQRGQAGGVPLRLSLDTAQGDALQHIQRDVPVSFDQTNRRYTVRSITETTVLPPPRCESRRAAEHDPMSELEA